MKELLKLRDDLGLNEAIDWIVKDFCQDRDMDELDEDMLGTNSPESV